MDRRRRDDRAPAAATHVGTGAETSRHKRKGAEKRERRRKPRPNKSDANEKPKSCNFGSRRSRGDGNKRNCDELKHSKMVKMPLLQSVSDCGGSSKHEGSWRKRKLD